MGIGRIDNVQTDYPAIGWGNGLMRARKDTKARFSEYVGFFVTAGEDHNLDKAMEEAGYSTIEAQHPRQGAEPIIKRHWNLGENLDFLPVTMGTPATTTSALLRMKEKAAHSGVGIRWPQGERALVGIIGYIKPLAERGYMQPFKLGARSLMVDYILKALADHTRVCQFADSIVDRQKHPDPVELYEIVWRLGPGEQTAFGKESTSLVVPIVSMHPAQPDADYIKQVYITNEEIKTKAENDFPGIQQWANGFNNGTESAAEGENVGSGGSGDSSEGNGAQKPAQQSAGGNGKEEVSLIGIVTDQKINEKRTWMGFKLFTPDEQEQFCSIFFKGVIQKALTEISEGDSLLVVGYYEDDKLVVKRFEPYDAAQIEVTAEQADQIPF
jgi:hypothetical protein